MTLEIIVFIAGAVIGILIYWTESKSNRLYRLINKLTHAKKLQMGPEDKQGFIFKQAFLMRIVSIIIFYLLVFIAIMIVLPFSLAMTQYYVAMVVGTIIGTYIASSVLFANKRLEKIDLNKEMLDDAIEKGKDLFDGLKNKTEKVTAEEEKEEKEEKEEDQVEEKTTDEEEDPKDDDKSARDRLKDKGLL